MALYKRSNSKIIGLILTCCFLNYGLIFCNSLPILKASVLCQKFSPNRKVFPVHSGQISDFENIFSSKQKAKLISKLDEFKSNTGVVVAIVTLDSVYCLPENFDNYILNLANFWGIGVAFLNNGILIGVSAQFKKIRICNGLGIEKVLTDEKTKEIMDNEIIPKFKRKKYFRGIMNGLNTFEDYFLTHQIVVI